MEWLSLWRSSSGTSDKKQKKRENEEKPRRLSMLYSNGDRYEGEWLDGEPHGEGIYFAADGSVFKGKYKYGKEDGHGSYRAPNGMFHRGIWRAGLLVSGDFVRGQLTPVRATGDISSHHHRRRRSLPEEIPNGTLFPEEGIDIGRVSVDDTLDDEYLLQALQESELDEGRDVEKEKVGVEGLDNTLDSRAFKHDAIELEEKAHEPQQGDELEVKDEAPSPEEDKNTASPPSDTAKTAREDSDTPTASSPDVDDMFVWHSASEELLMAHPIERLPSPIDNLSASRDRKGELRMREVTAALAPWKCGKMVQAWCSWCLRFVFHGQIEWKMLRRSVHKCTFCSQKTLFCRKPGCNAMARATEEEDCDFCLKHMGIIRSWEKEKRNMRDFSAIGWCSWCFQKTKHVLAVPHVIGRDTYRCQNCQGATLRCTTCQEAFGRCFPVFDDIFCAKCSTRSERHISSWENMEENQAKMAGRHRLPRKPDPTRCFAPVRDNIKLRWLVDGKMVFDLLWRKMDKARHHIYISAWIMCPTIQLHRDHLGTRDESKRFSTLLSQVAQRGVLIYILLWHEPALTENFSKENKRILEGIHPNIKVLRHPPFTPIMWSHHQKFIIIDDIRVCSSPTEQDKLRTDRFRQAVYSAKISTSAIVIQQKNDSFFRDLSCEDSRICFIGGLDVHAGRYDWYEHRICDPEEKVWWGVDYYCPFHRKLDQTREPDRRLVDQTRFPRMPWHDIQLYLSGVSARDVAYNFVQRWNHHKFCVYKYEHSDKYPLLTVENEDWYRRYDETGEGIGSPEDPELAAKWIRKRERQEALRKESVVRELRLREKECRYWEKERRANSLGSVSGEFREKRSYSVGPSISTSTHSPSPRPFDSTFPVCHQELPFIERALRGRKYSVACQVVRSLSSWSGGSRLETSLYAVHMKAIQNAQHFIYIEQQYFVSSTAGGGVENQICQLLVNRIAAAIEDDEVFRVIILMPQPEELTVGGVLPLVTYQYLSLCRGPNSMMGQLKERFPDVNIENYLFLGSLRNYGWLGDTPVTEQIFVHSKLMIVDDRVCLMTSANYNDRSFRGSRDSEIGMYIVDGEQTMGRMNGAPYLVNRFAHDLRRFLFKEHLCLDMCAKESDILVVDPISSALFNDIWLNWAHQNTEIYESVFPNIPQDSIVSFSSFSQLRDTPPRMEQAHRLKEIRGHVVMFPVRFLEKHGIGFYEVVVFDTFYQ